MDNDQELEGNDFASGFDGTATEIPPADTEPPKEEAPPAPEYVQITKQDWEALQARAAAIDAHGSQLASVHGSIGNLKQRLDGLKASGGVSDEDLAELEAEYPDLANLSLFKKLKGTAPAATGGIDPAEIEKLVQQRVDPVIQQVDQRVERAVETRLLETQHEDWREVVGMPEKDGDPIPQTEYRKWLATQPAEYQQKVGASWSHRVIGESITKFKQAQKAAQAASERANQRRQQLAAAVPARGDTAVTHRGNDDDFEKAFEQERNR